MSSPNYALRHLGQDNASYSSECVEEKFSEVRGSKVGQPLPYLGLSGRGAYALALYSRTSWNKNSRKFTVTSGTDSSSKAAARSAH